MQNKFNHIIDTNLIFFIFTELKINGNTLHTLPDELRNLQELQHLDVSNNNLDRIPQVVYQCVRLKQLQIHTNSISGMYS